jgi:hypothetical protein
MNDLNSPAAVLSARRLTCTLIHAFTVPSGSECATISIPLSGPGGATH